MSSLRDAQGYIRYKGRRDGQIKIDGFRVEFGEVLAEKAACASESAGDSPFLMFEHEASLFHVWAKVVSSSEGRRMLA